MTVTIVAALITGACGASPDRQAARFVARADAHAEAGRWREAAIEYRNALQWRPRAEIHGRLAKVYDALGERAQADASYIDAAQLGTHDLDLLMKASEALLGAGRPRDAERVAARALADHGRESTVLVMHARASLGAGQTSAAERDLAEALTLAPESPLVHLILGVLHRQQGDVAAARASMEHAVRNDPRYVDGWMALAQVRAESGDGVAAEHAWLAALDASGGRPDVRRRVVSFYLRAGRGVEAETHLRLLAETLPEDRLALADYYLSMRRGAEANAVLAPLLADPAWASRARLRRALVGAQAGRRTEALADLDEAVADAAVEPDARLLKGELLLAAGDYAGAFDETERVARLRPRAPEPAYLAGLIRLAQGDLKEAERRFKQARDLGGDPVASDLQLTRISAARGELQPAIAMARRIVQRAPAPATYAVLAQALRLGGDVTGARRELQDARRRWPDAVALDIELGMLNQSIDDRAGARNAYRRALRRDPNAAIAANNLAWLLAGDGEVREALRLARQAEASAPGTPQILDTVGWMSQLAGQAEAAIEALTQARDLVPGNPLYHYHLGIAYSRAGRPAEGRSSLERALALSSSFEGADEARRVLQAATTVAPD